MRLRRWVNAWPSILICAVLVGSIGEIVHARHDHQDLADPLIAVGTLFVATLTLVMTAPRPAKLVVIRQEELELDDLIFFLVADPRDPSNPTVEVIPRDYLLQLQVAICNLGNRKAVLSKLTLQQFLTADGKPVSLPDAPATLDAHRYVQEQRWEGGTLNVTGVVTAPPFVLEPDDVMTLRFRTRRGIDWSEHWDIEQLQRFHNALADDVARARGEMVWRRGDEVVRTKFEVPVVVNQQTLYRNQLRELTSDFTVRPHDLPIQFLSIE